MQQCTTGRLALLASTLTLSLGAAGIAAADDRSAPDASPYIITSGDPQDPLYANAGANLRNGVGSIFVQFVGTAPGGFICTASAIGPRHILTAAHCVTEGDDTVLDILFVLSAGRDEPAILETAGFAVNPLYYAALEVGLGAFAHGDIAVIELAEDLPAGTETYDLYRDFDEFQQQARHYGHGRSGKGNKGATGDADFFYARTGLNVYEQVLEPLLGTGIEDQLLSDFDSGGRKHNAMEWWFTSNFACHPENPNNPDQAQDGQCTTFKDGSYPDFKGYGKLEIGIAPGDSGGPAFIDDRIAGVHSFGFTHFCEGVTNGTDFTCGLDSSYGEMSGDTRVAFYSGWIDDVVSGDFPTVPVPGPLAPVSNATGSTVSVSLNGRAEVFLQSVFSRSMRLPAQKQ